MGTIEHEGEAAIFSEPGLIDVNDPYQMTEYASNVEWTIESTSNVR